ncbi:MAG: hypothetical protein ACI4JM_02075 [Oscillospiraceae bacterium]
MLFVQSINLYYYKDVRYPNYANVRNSIKFLPIKPEPNKFYPKEINSDTMLDCEVLWQSLIYCQAVDGLKLYDEKFKKFGNEIFTEGKYDTFSNYHNLIHNTRIFKEDDIYKIMFCDENFCSSRPKLHGHNESYLKKQSPFKYANRIYETAFRLYKNEYGRIIFNERIVEHDTGIWCYGLHTYNIISCDKSDFKEKMFFRKNPDYEYKQLKKLF